MGRSAKVRENLGRKGFVGGDLPLLSMVRATRLAYRNVCLEMARPDKITLK